MPLKRDLTICSNSEKIFEGCSNFSLLGTAAAFDLCSLVITNDSGLMHIASVRKKLPSQSSDRPSKNSVSLHTIQTEKFLRTTI